MVIYRLPPLPPTPSAFDDLMLAEKYGGLTCWLADLWLTGAGITGITQGIMGITQEIMGIMQGIMGIMQGITGIKVGITGIP